MSNNTAILLLILYNIQVFKELILFIVKSYGEGEILQLNYHSDQ